MIQGNVLSYSSVETPWHSLSLGNTTFQSLLTSVLVTVISYQAAAMIFDLVLGMKKKKEAKVKMIGMLMLAWKSSSPLTLCNNIFRRDWITRLYYKGDIPQNTEIARDGNRIKIATLITAVLLVVATPVVDIIFVALTLSKTRLLSFTDAGFGGVELGFRENLEVLDTVPYLTSCRLAKFDRRRDDLINARLSICFLPTLPADPQGNLTGVEVVVNGAIVQITVIVRGSAAVSSTFSELQTSEGSFLIKAGPTNSSTMPLIEMAKEALANECGDLSETGPLPQTRDGTVISSVSFNCGLDSNTLQPEMAIAAALQERLTLVTSAEFIVSPSRELGNSVNARELQFLQRSEPNASTFALICVAVAVIIARILSTLFVSNDVEDGLEYIVKSRLGLRECDSMFWVGQERLHFRKKFQNNHVAHLGLHQEGIPEVEKFRGGNLGGNEAFFDKT